MPVAGGGGGSKPTLKISSMGSSSHPHIDVRTVALRGFRDQIILPLFPRLYARLSMPNRVLENHGYLEPRCNQMYGFLSGPRHLKPLLTSTVMAVI